MLKGICTYFKSLLMKEADIMAGEKELPICKLCHLHKPLIEAHIIPDFMYKQSGLYDDKHRIRYFQVDELIKGKKPRLPQTGVFDRNILCADCDNRRLGSNLEDYAALAIYGKEGEVPLEVAPDYTQVIMEDGSTIGYCTNLDYTKYKLFLLSILWRASVSTQPFFKGINIGEHEEVIRQMIMNNDPKNFYDYPILVSTSATDKEFSQDMIIEPLQMMGRHGLETCCFIIGGFTYIFLLGTFNGNRDELFRQTINENNEIVMYQTRNGQTLEMIKNYVGLV